MLEPAAIGIDIGGTRLRAAAVTCEGRVVERRSRATAAHDGPTLLRAIHEVVEALGPRLPIGIGIAGLVDPDGTVTYGPNIGVRDLPLATRLRQDGLSRVVVTNDASAAALAEQRAGAGRGRDEVLLVTLGTGIGGGVVTGGRLLSGANGFAGEVGHVVVEAGGRLCGCGNLGCVEAYASGSAIGVAARTRLAEDSRASALRDVEDVDGQAVTRAAEAGDEIARTVLAESGRWLGIALASVCNVLDPELVLVGGGAAAGTAEWLLPAARISLSGHLVGAPGRRPPPVELATLGDDAGVVGAGLLAIDAGDGGEG